MLTAITYNCEPESLADVDQAAFVDAFENVVRCVPKYRNLAVRVTFDAQRSEVTQFSSDEADIGDPAELRDRFSRLAEKAFAACC